MFTGMFPSCSLNEDVHWYVHSYVHWYVYWYVPFRFTEYALNVHVMFTECKCTERRRRPQRGSMLLITAH
jgi:hypothetical protein